VYTGACAAHGRHHVVRTPRVTHKLVVARHISASLSGVDLHTAREPVDAEPQGRSQSTSIREECHSRGFGTFGFGSTAKCATRPAENNIGSPEIWERATAALRRAAELAGLPLTLDEGGGAFYGPKIDFKIKDALGREWQNATVQCDFNLPERFELKFTDSDGVEKRPIMVHRAILGSMERFVGCLIEHFGGKFPLWCAPRQVALIPIREEHAPYVRELAERLRSELFRVDLKDDAGHMNKKIKQAQHDQVPFMLIAGEREAADGTVAVRRRGTREQDVMPFEDFLKLARELRSTRALDLEPVR
jgi:threonyl-tRNA synthetase